ncbi:lipoprotein insertase outer membrane protein LolB [Thiolinea disciformis]|uniref:lipoprotein insertase outer membrane protein LolB n=1 Tax=Thiolinea disciformis TaxID=125614 RepID=UPI00036D8789|nr:lipoprotein insertase outer membrane protein LolB [Thiolinea disciformis]
MKQGLVVLCVLAVMSAAGCTSNQSRSAPSSMPQASGLSPEAAWAKRQTQVASMAQWRLQGRVGLQIREQSWPFAIDWQQQQNGVYAMQINNPLTGALMAAIDASSDSSISLKASNGQTYRDTDAERLLSRQLKLNFPLNNLRYWVRGIPAPNSPVGRLQLDAYGRPTHMEQAGWVIDYPAYRGNSFDAMPEKIQLEKASEQVKAKVVAKQWQTRY